MNSCLMPPLRPIDAPKFAYNGGKANLRRFIVRWLPLSGSHYVEPFAGRGNVFWLMRTISQFSNYHINDIRTLDFYKALLEYKGEELMIPPAGTLISEWLPTVPPHVARILEPQLCWAGGTFATTKKACPVGNRDIVNLRRTVETAKLLLEGVQLTELCAIDIIRRYTDDPLAILYLDPPYLGATVSAYSDKDLDWDEFYRVLSGAKCRWIMSEYQHPSHDVAFGFPKVFYHTKVMAGGRSKPATEVLYSNFEFSTPHILDFKESVKSPLSTRCLYKAGEVLALEEVFNRMPLHWDPKNCKIEFNILQKHPNVYFDGKLLHFLEGFE